MIEKLKVILLGYVWPLVIGVFIAMCIAGTVGR